MAVELVTDPETGDVYKMMTFDFKVNYCAHGSESPDVVLARATAIMGVASLAQRLGELVNSHYLWFHKSKAEMEEIKAQKQASEERRELERFVTAHSIRQVTGKTRRIESVHGFSTAVHTVILPNDRRFEVDCRGTHVVYLTRLD